MRSWLSPASGMLRGFAPASRSGGHAFRRFGSHSDRERFAVKAQSDDFGNRSCEGGKFWCEGCRVAQHFGEFLVDASDGTPTEAAHVIKWARTAMKPSHSARTIAI